MKNILILIASLFFAINYSQLYIPYSQVLPTINPSSNNFGIGTNYPSSKLDVNFEGEPKTMKFIDFPNGSSAMNAALRFTWYNEFADFGVVRSDSTPIEALAFRFNGSETARFLPNGKFILGGKTELARFTINGLHANTSMMLHSDNGTEPHAYLSLWASEPDVSYNGVGIGNNIRNYFNGQSFTRINTSAGGSYMRLLDNEINFNTVSASGTKKQVMTISPNAATFSGNVGIGTENPQAKLDINGNLRINNATDHTFVSLGKELNDQIITDNSTAKHYGGGYFFRVHNENIEYKYIDALKISDNGNVAVANKLEAREVKVTTTPTADFVFAENYNLPKLEEVEKHIKEKKHLPEIASAKEMQREGVNVGEFQIKLLQKIEELTLYTIDQNKLNKEQENQINIQNQKIEQLEKLIQELVSTKK
jgi:hypothetical protein